jgi:MarR family transcriptional regulator, organic hydroperoxide resistance regulator
MAHPHEALVEEVLTSLVMLFRAMHSQATLYWVDLDLSLAQIKTLVALGDLGTPTIGEIATVLEVSQPTASHLVERLVQSDLARRNEDAHNRRRTLVHLTPRGEEMLGHLMGYLGLTETLADRLSALSEEELSACVQGMSILSQALTRDPTLLSFTSHLTERVRPAKSKGPRSEENTSLREDPPENNP